GTIDEEDFMDRAKLLCAMGHSVLISNFKEYYKLVEYLGRFTEEKKSLAMGVNNLVNIFDDRYYKNLKGGTLEAFGKLFPECLKVYLYPYKDEETGEIIDSDNLKVPKHMHELYKYFKHNGKFVDIKNYHREYLDI